VVLVGRTEGLLVGGDAKVAIGKLVALADAGADCLYAPGISEVEEPDQRQPSPTLMQRTPRPASTFRDILWGAVRKAAERIKAGDFTSLSDGIEGNALNAIFAASR
jgi:hypothetical protein